MVTESALHEAAHNKYDPRQTTLLLLLALVFATVPIAPAPKNIALTILMAYWLFSGLFWCRRELWLKQDWTIPVLLMFLLPWIGLLWSSDFYSGVEEATKSVYWLYGFAAASVGYDRYSAKLLVYAYLMGLLASATMYDLRYVGVLPLYKGSQYGFLNYISYSLLLVAGFVLVAYLFKELDTLKDRYLCIVYMLFILWSITITPGRSGYLSLLLALPWVTSIIIERRKIAVALSLIIATAVLFFSPVVMSRLELITVNLSAYHSGNKNTPIGLRLLMWQGAVKSVKEHPLIGVGTGSYRKTLKKLVPEANIVKYSHPHNSYLLIAVNYGLVGVTILGWFFYVVFKRGWRARRTMEGRLILVFLFVIGVGSLTDTQLLAHTTGVLLGIISGLPTRK